MAAQELARAGHTVYAGIREPAGRNAPRVATIDAFAAENGGDLHAIEMDVVSPGSVDTAIEKVLSEQGPINGIVQAVERLRAQLVRSDEMSRMLGCLGAANETAVVATNSRRVTWSDDRV